jgi:hypothetical protein
MLNVIPMKRLIFEFVGFCSGVAEGAVFWDMTPHHGVNENRSRNSSSSSSRNYYNTDVVYGSNVFDLVFLMFVTTFA